MMMPANFSAIAESEMTYVVGGASLIDALGAVTAPVWNAENVKTFNTNMIQIVGNTFVPRFVNGTLGILFGGNYLEKNQDGVPADKKLTVLGKNKGLWNAFDRNGEAETSGVNKFLAGVGALAAVYTLGTAKTKSYVAENTLGIYGK